MNSLSKVSRSLILWLLKCYRLVSPAKRLLFGLNAGCRFSPTCSEYAMESVKKYGLWRSLPRILRRICRCNPLGRGGFDPVR